MCGRVTHGNREAPERRSDMRDHERTAQGKANRRNPCVGATGESDGDIVPGKLANKGEQPPAESMEGREPTKRNSQNEATHRVQDRDGVSKRLERVRQQRFDAKHSR